MKQIRVGRILVSFTFIFTLLVSPVSQVFYPSPQAEDTVWPELRVVEMVDGLVRPAHITNAGDGSKRIFVVEQPGRIRIIQDGALSPIPFLDIADGLVRATSNEQGLLSVAFPPDYNNTGVFYVNYTRRPDGATVVSRFSVSDDDPNKADPDSEEIILTIAQPFRNHNGGQLSFGLRDGYLYIGMGDGGSGGDPGNRAQNPDELLGKMLRIDVTSGLPVTYTIPHSNPFTQTIPYRGEIWALGLRNPWRFSFDPATGDLYIADVGQNHREEVSFQAGTSEGGENYGWRILEGTRCFNPASDCVLPDNYVPPAAEYTHDDGCSVTGGMIYRGIYYYADYCSGRIWGLRDAGEEVWEAELLLQVDFNISSFGKDEEGRLYVADHNRGRVHRIRAASLYLPILLKRLFKK